MSRNDHENITLILPAAAVAPLKKALREKTNSVHDLVKAEAVRLHKSFGTRSVKTYAEKLHAASWEASKKAQEVERRYEGFGLMLVGNGRSMVDPYEYRRTQRNQAMEPHIITSLAFQVLEYVILRGAKVEAWEKREPTPIHQPTTADVARIVPKLTNKDAKFELFDYQGAIVFEGREVRYYAEGNHGVEQARNSMLGLIFFAYLEQLTWTRGTGGFGMVICTELNYQDTYAIGP